MYGIDLSDALTYDEIEQQDMSAFSIASFSEEELLQRIHNLVVPLGSDEELILSRILELSELDETEANKALEKDVKDKTDTIIAELYAFLDIGYWAINLARDNDKGIGSLWVNFFDFLSKNLSPPLTECTPLAQILAYSGPDKRLLLDKSLFLLFYFIQHPQTKALAMKLYQLYHKELHPLLSETQQQIIKRASAEINAALDSCEILTVTQSTQLASTAKVHNEPQPAIALDKQAIIPSIEGYYSGEDIDLLIKALLKQDNYLIENDYLVSVKDGKGQSLEEVSTYVLPATSNGEGLGHLGDLINFIASRQNHACQVLIPYKVSGFEHWVSIFVHYQDNQFSVTVYDSLANAKTADKTIDEVVSFMSLTQAKVIKYPLQKPKRIQNGNVYCGGYTAHVIAEAAMHPPQKPDGLNDLKCISNFLINSHNDSNHRANDAKIVGTQKPEGYRRYALQGDGHQSLGDLAKSDQAEKEIHHRCEEEFIHRFNDLSQEDQEHFSTKLNDEINNLVQQLNATKESHKTAKDALSSYLIYCSEELKIPNEENPFAVFFKPIIDLQSIETDPDMRSLDVFIKERLVPFSINQQKATIQALVSARVNSAEEKVIDKDRYDALVKKDYYRRLARAMAESTNEEVWDFIKHFDAQENPIFFRPLILVLQGFITIHDEKDDKGYQALHGLLKEDKLFHYLNDSKILAEVPAIKIEEICNNFLQPKFDSANQQNVGYVLSEVMKWLLHHGWKTKISGENHLGQTVLIRASAEGRFDVVQWLLLKGGAVITETDSDGNTALLLAAAHGWIEMVQWLLEENKTARMVAAAVGKLDLKQWLFLERRVASTEKNSKGNTALLCAAAAGKLNVVQWLLREGKATINEKNYYDFTALLLAASGGWLDLVQWLLRKGGASIAEKGFFGSTTALLCAAAKGKLDVVQWLLKEGGSTISEKDCSGKTALLCAAAEGKLNMVQWLLQEGGATITEKDNVGYTGLIYAIWFGKLELVQCLFRESVAVSEKNSQDNIELLYAAAQSTLEVLQWLIVQEDFIFTIEEIDLALSSARASLSILDSTALWLDFYKFLCRNPSLSLTKCKPLNQILAYMDEDSDTLLDKSLSLLFSLFESPQRKALGLTIYKLYEQELEPHLYESQQQILKRVLDEENTDFDFHEYSTQLLSIQYARSQDFIIITHEEFPELEKYIREYKGVVPEWLDAKNSEITLGQEAVVPSVEGYYSGEDIDLLIKALLKQNNYVIEKDYLFSAQQGKRKWSTYVLPATSKGEGLGHLRQLIDSLASRHNHSCSVLIPYKVSRFEHWVSILVHYQDNQFRVTVYDSLANVRTADETMDEIVNFMTPLTIAKVIKYPLQKLEKIQEGNVYCGGYTAHVIAEAATLKNPDGLRDIICIDEFLLESCDGIDDCSHRANDAKIVGTEKPEGYRRYALQGDGRQSLEDLAKSDQAEKEIHHRCEEKFIHRFNHLSQEAQDHLSTKLHDEINNLVQQLNATKESHKVAIDVLSSYRNYCREELKIANEENPFAIFFKPKADLQSDEIKEEMTSLDVFIKKELVRFDSNHSELLDLAKVNSDAEEIIIKDNSDAFITSYYYQRLAKAMAGIAKDAKKVWDFIKQLDTQKTDIFYSPLILELQTFITIHGQKDNNYYRSLDGSLKEDKLFHFLNSSQILSQAPAIKIKETCDCFLQAKPDSVNPEKVDYVLSNVVQWLLQEEVTKIIGENNFGDTALDWAIECGQFDVGRWLLQEGESTFENENNSGRTALLRAASFGELAEVQRLLREGGAIITDKDRWGYTALLKSASAGSLDVVQWLLREGGAKITEKDNNGYTALLMAAERGHLAMVQWLLQEGGATITDKIKNGGNTALLLAAAYGQLDVVQWLLRGGRASITEKKNDGNTALLMAAMMGQLDLVQWLLQEAGATITEKNIDGNTVLQLAVMYGQLKVVQWLLVEGGFIYTNEEIDLALSCAREDSSDKVALWLDFYKFISMNPSPLIPECMPFASILAFTGKDKALLLDKSLSLLFSLFELPQKKALALALYQLHEQEIQPLLCESQQQIIKLALDEKNTAPDSHEDSTPLVQSNVNNEQQPTLDQTAVIPMIEDNNNIQDNDANNQIIKAILDKITRPDLFVFALKDAFSDRFNANSNITISPKEKSLLPERFTQRIKKTFETIDIDKILYENIMLYTCILMYKLMHKCQPNLLPLFIERITTDLRGNKEPRIFINELNRWREHPNAAEDDEARVFQDALVILLKSKDQTHQDYKLLFERPKKELKSSNKNLFLAAREAIEAKVIDLFIQRAPFVVHAWIAEGGINLNYRLIEPALAVRSFLFTKRREAFVKRHPCGPDDSKVPTYYKKVIEHFEFKKNTPEKIAFIVVAHFVHTLPYFLEAVSALGAVVALISKQSGTVKSVRKSILDIYKDIIVPNLDKNNLKENSTQAESFFSSLFEKEDWQDHHFIILDHGGYFAPRIDDVLKKHRNKIIGVVEHTWNGEVRYQEQLKQHHLYPFPIMSVAHSTLKGLESRAVANSIVNALNGKIFTGEGISQTIDTLQRILIIGYGHIGKAVAMVLKNILGNKGKDVICICDTSDNSIIEAKREFSKVTKEKRKYLKDADLIITATSTLALTKKNFSKLKSGAFIACATSSDDQFTEEAIEDYLIQEGPTKKVQSLCPKYKHKNSEKFFYLIANGDSVNFTIGSTPHPIIHIVLTSIWVDALELIKTISMPSWDLKQINLFNRQDEFIKKIYEETFGRIASEDNSLTSRIQMQSMSLIEQMDKLKPHKNYLNNYMPVPMKMANNKNENSDLLIPMVFDQKIQKIIVSGESGQGKTFLLHYFMRLWSKTSEFRTEIPYVFYIKLSLYKDETFKQYPINSTELMDLSQVLLILQGIQEGRTLISNVISNSSSWYEIFSYELAKYPERFCFFIDNSDIALKENMAYKTIGQIVEKLMKGQPQCKVVVGSNKLFSTLFFADKLPEIVRLLPWPPELLQRSPLINTNLIMWLDTHWLLKTTVCNIKALKKQFKFLSNSNQLKPAMPLTQQTQMLEEILWNLQSKHALQHVRKYINDTLNGFYKKSQDEFNEKSLSKVRGYFPEKFNFLKLLARAMMDEGVNELSRDECEELWLKANESKKSKKANQQLKMQLQAENLLQILVQIGFLCIANADNSASYQFSQQWLSYFYAVWWVEKFSVKETKKEAIKFVSVKKDCDLFQQYAVGMLGQKKDSSKLLNEFHAYLQGGPTKQNTGLAKSGFFSKSEEKVTYDDKLISNSSGHFTLACDQKSKKDSKKATDKPKHGNNIESLFQFKNKQSKHKNKEDKLDNNNESTNEFAMK